MLLLDTHVLLWALSGDRRLGPLAREALTGGDRVYFSAASIWELVIKEMIGKIALPPSLLDDLAESGIDELAVRAEHATAMRGLVALARHDPFDRLLVSQARVDGMLLLTADRVLLELDLPELRDARA